MNKVKGMFYLDWKLENYKASIFANGLIYFLGRIPILGKMIPTTMLYREYGLKKAITVIKMILHQLMKLVLASLPLVMSYFLANIYQNIFDIEISGFVTWLLLFPMFGSFIGFIYYGLDNKDLQFVSNFRISKTLFLKNNLFLTVLKDLIFILIPLIVVGFIEKKVLLVVLIGLTAKFAFAFMSLFIGVKLTLHSKRVMMKLLFNTLHFVLLMSLVVGLTLANQMAVLSTLFFNYGFVIFLIALGGVFFYLFLNVANFDDYAQQVLVSSQKTIDMGKKSSQENQKYLGEGKKVKIEKTQGEEELQGLTGSRYLNALLFRRFRSSLRRSTLIRVGIVSAVMLSVIIFSLVVPFNMNGQKLEEILYNFIPSLFFILYLLSMGKKVVQTIFINCDASMLNYPFYRESRAIVQGFFYRFLKIFYYNGIVVGIIYLWMLLFNFLNHSLLSWEFIVIVLFVMISLAILFSFHELFVYYILQPFTSDMEVKNPVYKFVDYVFYFLAYISLQIKSGGFEYGIIVSVISVVYFMVGLVIITKFAPKTFKLKN